MTDADSSKSGNISDREMDEADAWEYWHQRALKTEARVAELEAALRPFTTCEIWDSYPDDAPWLSFESITHGDLRRARAALKEGA
jgi:hypothetical protein